MLEKRNNIRKDQHFDENRGFMLGDTVIAEFEPTVIEKYTYKDLNSGIITEKYTVNTKDIYGNKASNQVSDFLKIDWYKDFEIIDVELSTKGKRILAAKLQNEARCLEPEACHEEIIAAPGFYMNNEIPFMVMGNRAIMPKDKDGTFTVKSSSDFRMKEEKIFSQEVKIKEYINFMPRVTVILFYAALLGAIKPILNQLSVITDFIIGVVAPSGHLKTSLTRIYTKWLQDEEELEISFDDTIRSDILQRKIAQNAGQNFLIDDLHRKASNYDQNKFKERLDKAARMVSKVGNSALIFITAESLRGEAIFSGYDRILQIRIPKMSSEELESYKNKMSNLTLSGMSEIAVRFVQKLIDNYEDVKITVEKYTKNSILNNHRPKFEMPKWCNGSTRIGNQIRVLYLVEDLFCQYMCGSDTILSGRSQLREALEESGKIQVMQLEQVRYKEEDKDLLEVLHEIILEGAECKDIKIVLNQEEYSEDEEMALSKEDAFYIRGPLLINVLMCRMGRVVTLKEISDRLHNAGVLEEEWGEKVNKRTKQYKNKRHYVINKSLLDRYCRVLKAALI